MSVNIGPTMPSFMKIIEGNFNELDKSNVENKTSQDVPKIFHKSQGAFMLEGGKFFNVSQEEAGHPRSLLKDMIGDFAGTLFLMVSLPVKLILSVPVKLAKISLQAMSSLAEAFKFEDTFIKIESHGENYYLDQDDFNKSAEILGLDAKSLSENASKDVEVYRKTVTKAYRKLARLHHPDKGGDAEIFKKIGNAYEALLPR